MSSIEERFTEISHLLTKGEGARPERALEQLIRQMSSADLSDWRPEIERSIRKFRPKRQRNLSAVLASRTRSDNSEQSPDDPTPAKPRELDPDLEARLQRALDELREHHIFQWSTFYLDCLGEYLPRYLDEMHRASPDTVGRSLATALADHTRDAFTQGYDFARGAHTHEEALRKSTNGLSRFLALPLDFYSARSSASSDVQSASALRLLVSAAMSGILVGYRASSFGHQEGRAVLPRFPRAWVHYLAFLVPHHAEEVIGRLESGLLADGLRLSVLPLLDALQAFHDRTNDDYRPLPLAGQFRWAQYRLDIQVRPPHEAASQRLLEVSAFLDENFVSQLDLDDAARRQVTLVIAPLRPDVRTLLSERNDLARIVVTANETRTEVAERAFRVSDEAVAAQRTASSTATPITYNFARNFPLHVQDRNWAAAYHVTRTSVRDLLRVLERRPGVRLWCSVRRSGKTTACLDLNSTSGDTTIVSQTCGAGGSSDDKRFYTLVRTAVEDRRMVGPTFVRDAVAACAPPSRDDKRLGFVVDEYEILFGLLRTAVEHDPGIRYAVVQPILDQLLTFSYDNLLVFLGQQPDAHFILMDQNQLAPYVQQDPFPLFEHAPQTTTGEFSALVRKILGDGVECTARFLDALFGETAGHPYLTANVLGELVEWLIEEQRPASGLRLRDEDFRDFAKNRLTVDRILLSPDYRFFREAAADALSLRVYRRNPWLFSTYWVLRELANGGADAFRSERSRFFELMQRIPVPQGEPAPDHNEILRSASQANFLAYDDDWVRVRIPVLGRIAAAVRPRVA